MENKSEGIDQTIRSKYKQPAEASRDRGTESRNWKIKTKQTGNNLENNCQNQQQSSIGQ